MKIKKRIISGEIEKAKKLTSQEKLISIIFIVLVIVISTLGVIAFGKQKIVNRYVPDTKNKDKEINPLTGDDYVNYEDVEITEEIQKLFDNIHSKKDLSGDTTIYNNKKLNVSQMTDDYKFQLACNIYCPLIKIDNTNAIIGEIEEEKVKEAYESLFGDNTYNQLEEIPYYNNKLTYDTRGRYILTKKEVYGTPSLKSKEKIIQVQKKNNTLYITSAVIFVESNFQVICKDFNCETILEHINNEGENYYNEYINNNLDNIEQYIYKFNIKDDKYYYLGYEKTNEQ